MLTEKSVNTKKPIITINEFLKEYEEVFDPDDESILNLDFELGKHRKYQKINPKLQIAKPDDAEIIAKLFKNIYHGTYPYKKLENIKEIRSMIKDPDYEWILFKIKDNKTIGCFGTHLEMLQKKALLYGFIIKKEYQHIVDTIKTFTGCLLFFLKSYKNKILIWHAEVRTNDSTPQYVTSLCGLKPIAFFPNKDIFLNCVESDFLIITYDNKVLKELRCKNEPRIIRQVLNCYNYTNKRYNLGLPIIENPDLQFDNINLRSIKNQIETKRVKDKIGNEFIAFSIKNSNSYFKFKYNPFSKNFENTEYKINRLEELHLYIKEMKVLMNKENVRYAECFVSSYKPSHQITFFDLGFKPRGYIPSWMYNKKEDNYEDRIVFNYYKGTISDNIKLISESKDLLKDLNIIKEEFIPESLEITHK